MNIHLIRLDPYDPNLGVLVPIVAKRVMEFAREHSKEMDSLRVAQGIMVPLWSRDPMTVVLAMVNAETGVVVGHAVIQIATDGTQHWVTIPQTQADGAVGDAVKRSIEWAESWVKREVNPLLTQNGRSPITQMVMVTGRNEKAWERTYGFKVQRRVMSRPLGAQGEEGPTEGVGE